MKFQQKLEANKHSDWPYIDYKGIKTVLKAVIKATGKAASSSLQATPDRRLDATVFAALRAPLLEPGQSPHESMLTALREQRDKVERFYVEELERHRAQLQLLLSQFEQPATQKGMSRVASEKGMTRVMSSSSLMMPKQQRTQRRLEASIGRASTEIYRTLQHLRNYVILNYTGLLKLAKKFDKQHMQELEEQQERVHGAGFGEGGLSYVPEALLGPWTEELSRSSFVSADALDELSNTLERAFADSFCDGSIQAARATLLVRKERPNSNLLLSLGARLGFALGLVVWIVWDVMIDCSMHLGSAKHTGFLKGGWLETQLPLVRAGGAVVVVQYLWALCLYVWNRARINFEFMLDFGPKVNTSALVAASVATRTCIFYLLSILLFLKALIGELPRHVPPGLFLVGNVVLTLGALFGQHGRGLVAAVFCVLAAPTYPVDFASVLVGDVLTSLVKPMQDVVYSLCYIVTGEFNLPYDLQGSCRDERAVYHEVLVPLLCALPLWCRFMQCLRVAHDSGKRVPALPNALKYSISLLVVLFGEMHPALIVAALGEPDRLKWMHVLWIGIYLCGTFYNIVWDVVMDWKLQPWNWEERGLRPRRMFAQTAVYYAAVGVDIVLRFAWTATLVPHWFQMGASEGASETKSAFLNFGLLPIVIVAELWRRAMWAIFRLESEHLHNTEGFRRVAVVPLHFDHSAQKDKPPDFTRREVLMELLVYAVVVAVLAYGATQDPMGRGRGPYRELMPPSPPWSAGDGAG